MAVLSIKDFDSDLMRALKAKAALSGELFRDYVTAALRRSVDADSDSANERKRPARATLASQG